MTSSNDKTLQPFIDLENSLRFLQQQGDQILHLCIIAVCCANIHIISPLGGPIELVKCSSVYREHGAISDIACYFPSIPCNNISDSQHFAPIQSSSADGLVSILKRRRASLDGLPPEGPDAAKHNSKRKVHFSQPEDGMEPGMDQPKNNLCLLTRMF